VFLYRLTRRRHADLTGAGGWLQTGRWHARKGPILYTAESRALAMLETLVNLEVELTNLPDDYGYQVIEAPDDDYETVQRQMILPGGKLDHPSKTAAYGSRWLLEMRSLLLVVPSIVIPRESNVIVNPYHPGAKAITTTFEADVQWDSRLFKN